MKQDQADAVGGEVLLCPGVHVIGQCPVGETRGNDGR